MSSRAPIPGSPSSRSGPDDGRNSTPLKLWVATVIVLAGTLLLYQPWRRLPFDITDFSEFLPLLHRPSLGARWIGFLQYYASQGRWNVLAYAVILAKWSVFGMNTAGWELVRFAEMWIIIALSFLALRRFGADAWGAAAGAALLTIATPAVPAWLRLTMGEPLGFVPLLGALLIATRYRSSAHWRRDAISIAMLVALALLSKEMLVVFVPFIVVIAACLSAPGRLEWPLMDRRTVYLVGCIVIATIAVLTRVALIAIHAPAGNYASQYGGWKMDPGQLSLNFATVVLPVTQSRPGEIVSLFTAPANALFLLTLAASGVLIYRNRAAHGISWSRAVVWIGLALSLPVFVVIAYGPWSYFQDFYGLPYVLGPAMLLAGAVTAAAQGNPHMAPALRAACAGILLLGAVRAFLPAQESFARRTVQGDVARCLADHASARSIPSFTAFRSFCLQPRYRSVVWTETCPSRNWICSSSPPARWHRRAQLRRRSWGARFAIPARRAAPFTTCQMAFGVMCSPQIAPVLLTARKIKLVVIPAARVQLSTVHFTQFGIGTVRTCFPVPIKSATTQCSSRI